MLRHPLDEDRLLCFRSTSAPARSSSGKARGKTNRNGMRTTLGRLKAVAVARSRSFACSQHSGAVNRQRPAAADSSGQLAAHVAALRRSPRTRSLDLLIAATADAHGATLYTRNKKDFEGLEGFLRVVRA